MAFTVRNWEPLEGWMAERGVEPLDLSIHSLLSLVRHWTRKVMDEKELNQFDAWLSEPPPGPAAEDPDLFDEGVWSAEAEMDLFRSLQASG